MASSAANPIRPKNSNATMSASKWGTIYVKILQIGHGVHIASSTVQTRFSRALYATKRTSGTFGLVIVCSSYDEYDSLGKWITGYGRKAASTEGGVGPVRVVVPSRNFDKVAIPSGVTFGDAVGAITYPVSINFTGARDPVPHTPGFISSFSLPTGRDVDPALPYFYPGGTQLAGAAKGDDALYDVVEDDSSAPSVPPPGFLPMPGSNKLIPE